MIPSRAGDEPDGTMGEQEGPIMVFEEPSAGGVVAASDGWSTYCVWHFRGLRRPWECECPSFRIRGDECKHISAVKESVRGGRAAPGVVSFWRGQ